MNDWEAQARLLKCGTRRRIRCCSDDKSMLVNHTPKGYSGFCFRCKAAPFIPHGIQSVADIYRRQGEYRASLLAAGVKLELPGDFTKDIPEFAAVWYLKYGITTEVMQQYGCGYSPELARIVLPTYHDNELAALSMRSVRSEVKPKYLNPTGPRTGSVLFEAGVLHKTYGELTVLVEDQLSAIKVGMYCPSVSMLGSTLTEARGMKLCNIPHVIVWTDNDKAGINGGNNAVRQLLMLGTKNVYRVRSEKDPKCYTRSEIKQFIQGAQPC